MPCGNVCPCIYALFALFAGKAQQVQAAHGAFAALLIDGSVVRWGNQPFCTGGSAAIQDWLSDVERVQATGIEKSAGHGLTMFFQAQFLPEGLPSW